MKRKLTILLMSAVLVCLVSCSSANDAKIKLMPLVEEQIALGPRTPGSDAHARFISQTVDSLNADGWTVRCEAEKYQGKTIRNIVADRGPETADSWIVIGAHYDSRITADQ